MRWLMAAPLLLAGCASINTPLDDGYQWGDIGATRQQYCDNASPVQRAVMLALAYRAGASLPTNGACADVLEVLSNAGVDTPPPED